jgi:hypothetical protein
MRGRNVGLFQIIRRQGGEVAMEIIKEKPDTNSGAITQKDFIYKHAGSLFLIFPLLILRDVMQESELCDLSPQSAKP